MDWLRIWHASVGSAATGAGLVIGGFIAICFVLGFADVIRIVGGWTS